MPLVVIASCDSHWMWLTVLGLKIFFDILDFVLILHNWSWSLDIVFTFCIILYLCMIIFRRIDGTKWLVLLTSQYNLFLSVFSSAHKLYEEIEENKYDEEFKNMHFKLPEVSICSDVTLCDIYICLVWFSSSVLSLEWGSLCLFDHA